MKFIPLPASQDLFLRPLHDGHRSLVVDRDAQPARVLTTPACNWKRF